MAQTENGFYYPDDYTKVADVPEDIKKLAESVDVVAGQMKNNIDTNSEGIKQIKKENETQNKMIEQISDNILDISKEQQTQSANIEELQKNQEKLQVEVQELNEDIKANAIIEETEKTKSLYIDDANASRGKVNVFGNMEQEIREGYNLIDILNSTLINTNKSVEIEIDKDGYVIANGTPTADYIVFIRKSIDNLIEDKQTYSLWQEKYSTVDNGGVYSQILVESKEGSSGSQQFIQASTKKVTFVVDKSNYNYTWTLQIGLRSVAGTFNNYKNRYMLYKGTDNKEFELYGASPSLNYPSSIKCLGDNKQLFDGIFRQGNEVLTSSSTNVFSSNNISCNKDKDYTISTNLDLTVYRYALFTNTNSFPTNNPVTDSTGYKTESQTTIKSTVDGYIGILIGKKDNSAISPEDINKYYFKLEAGKIATSYSPHGQGSTEIKKINKNLYKLNVEGITKRGVNYSINNESIIAKRVESATSGSYFTTNRIKIPAGTYTFSGIDSSFVYANARVEIYATTDGDSKLISSISSTKLFYTHTFDKATEISFILVVTAATEIGNTYTFKPQVEVGSKNTEIVEHQEENYILEIQQEMLKGDYFDLERKKEVHNKEKIILDGSDDENWALSSSFSNVFTCNKPSNIKQYETDLICNITNNFVTSGEALNSSTDGIAVGSKINFKMANINTLEELKQYLNTTNIELYYRTTETTELDLTGSQIEVLEKLNKLRYYKGVNNIMTTEDIALLQAKYSQNLKVTNTKMQQQIDEIKELLSTTQTSAMLLDNLEKDLIEEVK